MLTSKLDKAPTKSELEKKVEAEAESEGGHVNMCKGMEDWAREEQEIGEKRGRSLGIQG